MLKKAWEFAYHKKKVGIIQTILDRIQGQTYLEIGVEAGRCFWRVNAARKIAVDPALRPAFQQQGNGVRLKLERLVRGPQPAGHVSVFAMTSDEFFSRYAEVFSEQRIDVALIDGLHTYDQSLRDVHHCLEYLSPRGVIVIHDCNPPLEAIAYPAPSFEAAQALRLPGWTGAWCGDVWKTIVHLRASRDDLRVFVLDCDWGVGIITLGHTEDRLEYSLGEIRELAYHDLIRNRQHMLNLKPVEYLDTFLTSLHVPPVSPDHNGRGAPFVNTLFPTDSS